MATKRIGVKETTLEALLAILQPDMEILLMTEEKVLIRLKAGELVHTKQKRIPDLHIRAFGLVMISATPYPMNFG